MNIVAWDLDGARYCAECAIKEGIPVDDEDWKPNYGGVVFPDDLDDDDFCSECGKEL